MRIFEDNQGRLVRLTDERLEHLESQHPEMVGQLNRILETLKVSDKIIRSKIDKTVELFYKHYKNHSSIRKNTLCNRQSITE